MKLSSIMFVATVALTIASPSRAADVKAGPPERSSCNTGTAHGNSYYREGAWVCLTTGKVDKGDKGDKGGKGGIVPNKPIDKDPAKVK